MLPGRYEYIGELSSPQDKIEKNAPKKIFSKNPIFERFFKITFYWLTFPQLYPY